jgi:hypothetical protein
LCCHVGLGLIAVQPQQTLIEQNESFACAAAAVLGRLVGETFECPIVSSAAAALLMQYLNELLL